MRDRVDYHGAALVVDLVHDPVVPPMGAVQPFQLKAQWSSNPPRVLCESAIDELNGREGNLLREAT